MAIFVDLVRHAETPLNALGIHQGRGQNVSLSDKGKRQAEALAQRLAGRKYAAIYSSPLKRALETADIIIAAQNEPLTLQVVDEFTELDHGVINGMRSHDIQHKYPRQWLTWKSGPVSSEPLFPGGDVPREEMERAMSKLEEIVSRHDHGERLLVVTHGGKMHLLILKVLQCYDAYHRFTIPNCGGISLIFTKKEVSGDTPAWNVRLYLGEPADEQRQTPP